ncbi:hypothetical protein ACFXP1_31590 [Streptomyces sp. NPDC059112]
MPLTDVKWVLGHAHLSTTEIYLAASQDEVIESVLAHHARRASQPVLPPRSGSRLRPGEPGRAVRAAAMTTTTTTTTVPAARRSGQRSSAPLHGSPRDPCVPLFPRDLSLTPGRRPPRTGPGSKSAWRNSRRT